MSDATPATPAATVDLDALFDRIESIMGSVLERYLSLGQTILDTLYEGDAALFHRRGRKSTTIYNFYQHERFTHLGLSRPSIYNAVNIYLQARTLGPTLDGLSYSHRLALLGAGPHAAALAPRARAESWSVQQLKEHIRAAQAAARLAAPTNPDTAEAEPENPTSDQPGAPTPAPSGPLHRVSTFLDDFHPARGMWRRPELAALPSQERIRLRQQLLDLQTRTARLLSKLDAVDSGQPEPEQPAPQPAPPADIRAD